MVGSKDTKRKRKESPPPTQSSSTSTPTAATTSQQQPTQSSSANIESSPEIPKRTKVQAQRKFAQGQSAPSTSSYIAASTAAATAACSNGPNTTASANRDPPIEILPNKKPKPEDFLTYLCFRGTNYLPPHLDFLNQGKNPRGRPPKQLVTKRLAKPAKAPTASAGATGRKKGGKPNNRKETAASVELENDKNKTTTPSKAGYGANAKTSIDDLKAVENKVTSTTIENEAKETTTVVMFTQVEDKLCKKGAEQAPTTTTTTPAMSSKSTRGARQLRNAKAIDDDKCNNSTSGDKRRSNRTSTNEDTSSPKPKDQKKGARANNATKKQATIDAPTAEASSPLPATSSKQTSKEPTKRGFKAESNILKYKPPPVKRPRQKESPIFIPSPEPSGRMTRQRAFFEPVKVTHRDESEETAASPVTQAATTTTTPTPSPAKIESEKCKVAKDNEKQKKTTTPQPPASTPDAGQMKKQTKDDLKVFDFSSDDEQPLAKAIKLKANSGNKKTSPKQTGSGRKSANKSAASKSSANQKGFKNTPIAKMHITGDDADEDEDVEKMDSAEKQKDLPKVSQNLEKGTSAKRPSVGKTHKNIETDLTMNAASTTDTLSTPPQASIDASNSNQKEQQQNKSSASSTRQVRKGGKANVENGESKPATVSTTTASASPTQQRSQRPTRKTKEAATIYMGIIGHKLQLADDEDDDLSLNSFPDLPNVKEVEKMEIELKKNATASAAAASASTATAATTTKTPSYTTAAFVISETVPSPILATKSPMRVSSSQSPVNNESNEKPTVGARRGRPPKNAKALSAAAAAAGTSVAIKREADTATSNAKKGTTSNAKKNEVSTTHSTVTALVHKKDKEADVGAGSSEKSKLDSDDEDFLLSKEVNVTKRNLAKSFSDSDDEPLAIKVHVKQGEKDLSEAVDKNSAAALSARQATAAAAAATLTQTAPPPTTTTKAATTTTAITALSTSHVNSRSIAAAGAPNAPVLAAATTAPTTFASHSAATSQQMPPSSFLPTAAGNATAHNPTPTSQSPFKPAEKKSPVPTSKILNVPATYGTSPQQHAIAASNYNKQYMPQPLPPVPVQYHAPPPPHVPIRACNHPHTPMLPMRMPPSQAQMVSMTPPPPPQSPLKYQPPPPTTYPPPIEAYPSPKINPNFLTPKYDRMSIPRANFPPPSPVKYETSTSSPSGGGGGCAAVGGGGGVAPVAPSQNVNKPPQVVNSTTTPKTPSTVTSTPTQAAGSNAINTISSLASPNCSAAVAAVSATAAATASADQLKDEIGSILAANLMPSKEESGKIFGIASVSLAQSSGPDNTKCTLGKCGSIHKPVLGPVVPTESYIGDQMSSKERRKAKVNMTHEQIQKWLNECSPNPDEIQDDLDDDYDDNLRPNVNTTTPPLTRDDKELSTSLSSSSKASAAKAAVQATKMPAATPVSTATPTSTSAANKRDEKSAVVVERDNSTAADDSKPAKAVSQLEKKSNEKNRNAGNDSPNVVQQKKQDKDAANATTTANNASGGSSPTIIKATKSANNESAKAKKNSTAAANILAESKNMRASTTTTSNATTTTKTEATTSAAGGGSGKSAKRTPVYNQKTQKAQIELKESTTTSHRKSAPFSYAAFSADNEKSVYTFDKDDDDGDGTGEKQEGKRTSNAAAANAASTAVAAGKTKSGYRKQGRRDSQVEEETATATAAESATTSTRTSPGKRRAAAAAADKANRDLANSGINNSISLTLSSTENSKQVKVSLETEKAAPKAATPSQAKTPANAAGDGKVGSGGGSGGCKAAAAKKQPNNQGNRNRGSAASTNKPNAGNDADSDSDGHTFYIPLQGSRLGTDNNGSIQGVAVKLGREGPEGPNQKVIMHATLVTKAQIGPESMPAASAGETSTSAQSSNKKGAKSATTAATASPPSVSPKDVPIGSVQPHSTDNAAADSTAAGAASTSNAAGGGLVRGNPNSSVHSGSAKSRSAAAAAVAAGATSAQAAFVGGSSQASSSAATAPLKKTFKDDTPIKMANNTAFPRHDDPTQMVEAPIFRPTEKEFVDPIEFIERITPIAARFGICKIVPPATFKPECRISDDMRFTGYNQYVHKMLHRWGPSAKELSAIKKYLATQSIVMNHPPWIGGMEVDLPRLYHTVQELGGLKEVIEKKKWARVAEEMCIPKLAQDRVTKLDDIYCKYLLPYDTLSPTERQKLFDEVEADWAKREARARRNADRFVNTESVSNEDDDDTTNDDDEESEEEVDGVSMECIVKGRSMALNQFYRIARNTMALWFKNTEPTVNEVEAEFWRHVAVRDSHVCVHSGSIDSSGWGYGFPSPGPKGKGSNYARHPWNLKVLTNNPGSVLRSLGPVMGVTVPTLHVGMLFSACCWYRDPHGLSWIEYLHTGASKLWYGIPDDQSANFRSALTSLIPTHCQNKTIWLPCDTVMVPPHMLTDRGVSLCRIEQKPGEFIVVFPRAYTSSLAAGYVVSESVYFATTSWLDLAKDDFRDIHESCEPAMFSLEQLLFALGHDQRVIPDTLIQMLPMLHEVCEKESAAREQLKAAGVTSVEFVHNEKGAKGKKLLAPFKSVESECDLCRANLYISMVRTDEENVYCLQHAIKNLNSGNIQAKQCKLIHAYQVDDIEKLIKTLNERIQQKQRNVGPNRKAK